MTKETKTELKRRIKELEIALKNMVADPGDLAYPAKDVWGHKPLKEDYEAPLWTECGLYGRVGKEAARTMLVFHTRAMKLVYGKFECVTCRNFHTKTSTCDNPVDVNTVVRVELK